MTIRDLDSSANERLSLPVESLDFKTFRTLPEKHQETMVSQLCALSADRLLALPELHKFLKWIEKNSNYRRHQIKSITKILNDQSTPITLSNSQNIGQILNTLYWNGGKRHVRQMVKSLLRQTDTIALSSNTDLDIIIHTAKLARLKTHILRYAAKFTSEQDRQALINNPSKNAILGELTYAGVINVEGLLPNREELTEPTLHLAPDTPRHSNCPNRRVVKTPTCTMQIGARDMNGHELKGLLALHDRSFRPQFGLRL